MPLPPCGESGGPAQGHRGLIPRDADPPKSLSLQVLSLESQKSAACAHLPSDVIPGFRGSLCSPGPWTKCLWHLGHIPETHRPPPPPPHRLWAPGTWKSTLKNLGTLAPNSVVLELQLAGELPGGTVKIHIAGPYSQSSQFSKAGLGPNNLLF